MTHTGRKPAAIGRHARGRLLAAGCGVRLDELDPGECGTVSAVAAGGDETARLMAMGVCTGRTVLLVRRGDPLILRVLGTRIGLSRRLAATVNVTRCVELPEGEG